MVVNFADSKSLHSADTKGIVASESFDTSEKRAPGDPETFGRISGDIERFVSSTNILYKKRLQVIYFRRS